MGVERKAKEIARAMGQDTEEDVDEAEEEEVIKEKEVVAPMYYLNKLVGITETVAGDVLKTMKKKNASPEAIKKYLPTDTVHVTEETKDKAANIDVQLIPARKQPMVAAMEAAGLTLPKKEITQTRQKN